MSELVLHQDVVGVRVFTLNAPRLRNAISVEMRVSLLQLLEDAIVAPAVRAIVLTGADAHFSSGGQLQNGGSPDPERTQRNVGILHDIVRLLHAGPKPTIAAVEGCAYGAGFSLATACDHVVAGAGARFCATFGRVGLVPDTGILWTLSQRVGVSRARRILMTGRVVDASEAAAISLADDMVAAGAALEGAIAAAQALCEVAPLSIAAMKRMMADGPGSLEQVLAAERDTQPRLTLTYDYAEGRAAFKERRPPVFRGA